MCNDVIPLVCSDWCVLAASFALAGGGGVGRGGRGGEGLNFPQIETSKCEQGPAWGRFRAPANTLHTCNTVNVLFLMSWLPVFGQFWCFKGIHKQGLVVMVLLVWWRCNGGERPGSDYVRLLHPASELCNISRLRGGGGRESREGWGYCEWKTKCFSDSHADVLRWTQQGAPILLSAGQGSSGASTALSHSYLCHEGDGSGVQCLSGWKLLLSMRDDPTRFCFFF